MNLIDFNFLLCFYIEKDSDIGMKTVNSTRSQQTIQNDYRIVTLLSLHYQMYGWRFLSHGNMDIELGRYLSKTGRLGLAWEISNLRYLQPIYRDHVQVKIYQI